ncbi:hypothetical protein [Zobellia laminariae]|uniref:hypothetical protein n=1 Tax=Zobellia laminariae TaxID=248906 RepID=UPI0034CF1948
MMLDASDSKILSGMYATVQFPVARKANASAIMIPTEALVEKGQLTGVYTISQSGTALLRWLRLGRVFGDKVEVLSGLSQEEQYVVSSEGKLFNGVKVSVQ